MKYYCNPLNLPYRYQFIKEDGRNIVFREAADPSLILFRDTYCLFPSMTGGFFTSDDLYSWTFHELPPELPVYDYAPDVRVSGEYLYFCASKARDNCSFYRTKDPVGGKFEKIEGTFPFWDPNLFFDDDGRLYFYWGCSNTTPIFGVELDPESLRPLGKTVPLIKGQEDRHGFERTGDDHIPPKSPEEIARLEKAILEKYPDADGEQKAMLKRAVSNAPYIEGAWMTKREGRYYLQYAASGTEFNVYADGVYVGDRPLGPFQFAENNPFSYKPGGFINGAGHGSTLEDKEGNLWHTASMRISRNHSFERRLGLWRAGFDADGELFCDQRYGDWPCRMDQKPWEKPDWMLLSCKKRVEASSGTGMENVTDEDIRTWWKADTAEAGEWVQVDLGAEYDVRAVQISFADDRWEAELPEDASFQGEPQSKQCFLDMRKQYTRWQLEGSVDGVEYFLIEDKSEAGSDLSHDFVVREEGISVRYLKLTVTELPYGQPACVSGLRVFGKGSGKLPEAASGVEIRRNGSLDMLVSWKEDGAVGHNVLWGHSPEKLYHSYMVFGKNRQNIGALAEGQTVYVRVDAFNENGITEGALHPVGP